MNPRVKASLCGCSIIHFIYLFSLVSLGILGSVAGEPGLQVVGELKTCEVVLARNGEKPGLVFKAMALNGEAELQLPALPKFGLNGSSQALPLQRLPGINMPGEVEMTVSSTEEDAQVIVTIEARIPQAPEIPSIVVKGTITSGSFPSEGETPMFEIELDPEPDLLVNWLMEAVSEGVNHLDHVSQHHLHLVVPTGENQANFTSMPRIEINGVRMTYYPPSGTLTANLGLVHPYIPFVLVQNPKSGPPLLMESLNNQRLN